MPKDVGVVDTMIGFPHDDMKAVYAFITRQTKDAESKEDFEFPAEYMFKDVPEKELRGQVDPIAVTIGETPRVVRLMRSVVLSAREEPYVEAAIAVGTKTPLILWRHVLPNCVPPLIVQATYVAASAMLTEALLSFLGAGTPPEIPSWGNMMAEGRIVFPIAPWIVLIPGCTLALAILAVNVLGDGLRDRLDPKIAKRM
jgi:ABC-type dipeptide/oligopeptide/nickel transport system permease subunit